MFARWFHFKKDIKYFDDFNHIKLVYCFSFLLS